MRRSYVSLPLCVVALISVSVGGCSYTKVTVDEIDQRIRKELPVGSDQTKVIVFLEANQMEHSGYLDKQKEIRAILRNTSRNFLVTGSIQVVFSFDDHGRLISHIVEEVFTGP